MDDVGEEVVVPEPVLGIDLLVVDRQRTVKNTPLLQIRYSECVCVCEKERERKRERDRERERERKRERE